MNPKQIATQMAPGGILDAAFKWVGRTPVTDVFDAAHAVLRDAVEGERRGALWLGDAQMPDLIADFLSNSRRAK
jgi:hypothetical protein